MYKLLHFQPSLLTSLLIWLLVVMSYLLEIYYMLFLHIILRWGGVTGPNSGLALEVHVEAAP